MWVPCLDLRFSIKLWWEWSPSTKTMRLSALRDAGLDYAVKVIDRSSPSVLNPGTRADFGTMGMSPGAQYEYIIYVNKRDYDAARDAAGLPGDIR